MIRFIYRILLTISATAFLLIVFATNKFLPFSNSKTQLCASCHPILSLLLLLLVFIFLFALNALITYIALRAVGSLDTDSWECGTISEIAHANSHFLPSYLGYFFVGLSVSSWQVAVLIYLSLAIFTCISQAYYFNPMFLLFGFNFYTVKTKNGAELFLISKKIYKNPSDVVIKTLYRLNDYTFIHLDENE